VLGAPDASGIAEADFTYQVLGGTGMFAGMTGSGTSVVFVLVGGPPAQATGAGIQATVACDLDPNGAVGSYCEVGQFTIGAVPEPATLSLLALGAMAALGTRRRRRS